MATIKTAPVKKSTTRKTAGSGVNVDAKVKSNVTRRPSVKSVVNNEWKLATRSMSGLVRYIKGDGKDSVQKYLNDLNERKGSNVTIGNLNTKNFVSYGKNHELNRKNGDKKELFSLWFALTVAGRIADEQQAEAKKAKKLADKSTKGQGFKDSK